MIAFDIYLKDEFVCRAAMSGKHIYMANVHVGSSRTNHQASIQVMGNNMEKALSPEELKKNPPTKEKIIEMMHALAGQGVPIWLQQKLDKDFEIDIHIVEADPESITPPEMVKPELNEMHMKIIEQSFGGMFPPKQT